MTKITSKESTPLTPPICGSVAYVTLGLLREDRCTPEDIVRHVENVRWESARDQRQGMFDRGKNSLLQAKEREIAELNTFLAQAWLALGKREVDIQERII